MRLSTTYLLLLISLLFSLYNALPYIVTHNKLCSITGRNINNDNRRETLSSLSSVQSSLSSSSVSSCQSILLKIRGGESESSLVDLDGECDDDEEEEGEEDEEEEEEEEEEDDDEKDDDNDPLSSVIPTEPIKILIKTNVFSPSYDNINGNTNDINGNNNNNIIDQSLELLVPRTRTIGAIKKSISKQMTSRPPIDIQRLLYRNNMLHDDDQLVDELIDDDDDDEDDEDDETSEEEKEKAALTLTLDIIPPVDPKFAAAASGLTKKLSDMTTSDILDAYVTNLASMNSNSNDLYNDGDLVVDDDEDDEEDDESTILDSIRRRKNQSNLPTSMQIRQSSVQIRKQIESTLPKDALDKLKETNPPAKLQDTLLERRGQRQRTGRGGAKQGIKSVIQTNLNINWVDTIRNFFLFLFFGLMGGRSSTSKALLMLGAPMCFILQARPVKVLLKQAFYLCSDPPSILLSLLAAPQQSILSFDENESYKHLYGIEHDTSSDIDLGAYDDDEYSIQNIDNDNEEEEDDDDDDDEDYSDDGGYDIEDDEY